MKRALVGLIFSVFLSQWPVLSQANEQAGEIKISTQVSATSIRAGDSLTYTITLAWPGEQNRYLIEELTPPLLENLHLLGTKSELGLFQENRTNYTRKRSEEHTSELQSP